MSNIADYSFEYCNDDKAELLQALQAVAQADTLEAAQEIACAAIALAIIRDDTAR